MKKMDFIASAIERQKGRRRSENGGFPMEKMDFIASAIETAARLSELAGKAAVGFFPFSQCRPGNKAEWEDAVVYLDDPADGLAGMSVGDVAADMLVEDVCGHHDIISGYGGILSELCGGNVRVYVERHGEDGGEGPYDLVIADFDCDPGPLSIVIDEDGWRVA